MCEDISETGVWLLGGERSQIRSIRVSVTVWFLCSSSVMCFLVGKVTCGKKDSVIKWS